MASIAIEWSLQRSAKIWVGCFLISVLMMMMMMMLGQKRKKTQSGPAARIYYINDFHEF
jgi:hypothetical protein